MRRLCPKIAHYSLGSPASALCPAALIVGEGSSRTSCEMDTVPLEESHVHPQACPGVIYTSASIVSALSWALPLDKRRSIATCYLFILAGSLLLHGLLSCCGEQGLLPNYSAPASHCSAFSCCRAGTLGVGSRHMGLVAPQQVGSSWTRDQTRVPCRRIFNHRTTRKSLKASFWIQEHLEIIREQFTYISGR